MESAERKTFVTETRKYSESYAFSNKEELATANNQFDIALRKQGIDPETAKKNSKNKKNTERDENLDSKDLGSGLSDAYFAWESGATSGKNIKVSGVNSTYEDLIDKFRMSCIQMLLRIFYPNKQFEMDGNKIGIIKTDYNENADNAASQKVNYILTKSYAEYSTYYSEEKSFKSNGNVVTEDGRKIDFNIDVSMSRKFSENLTYSSESIREVMQFTDPLVINFGNSVTTLSDQSFYFDIDGDGEEDQIKQLTEGSGYLALDKNEDGQINDGLELFGAKTGNGFDELAEYDLDNNGWIDENDEVFDKLKIWCRTATGDNVLYTLKEAGVGAICLSNADTEIGIGSDESDVSAYVRKTGIFLYETGQVGTVQHVDMGKLA